MSYILASNKEMLRLAAIAYVLLTRTTILLAHTFTRGPFLNMNTMATRV